MKKVVVIGSGGAGKSTFARRLGDVTLLPVIHLDKLYWGPNWTPMDKEDWAELVRTETDKPRWIMDGNFGGTREMRMRAADTIILLDLPRSVCVWRILKRSVQYYGRTRPDMADGCYERFDPEFIAWVWNYRKNSRQRALAELERMKGKRIVILKSRREVEAFLRDPYAS